jgi:hypothetical protein
MEPAAIDDLPRLQAYLRALPPQRLVLRSVSEFRPEPLTETTGISITRRVYVEVVTVQDGNRVSFTFDNVTGPVAAAAARSCGHDVVERNGNLT